MPLKDYTSLKRWELVPEPSAFARPGTSNKDLDPTPPEQRTWRSTDLWAYWVSDGANISTWEMGSSFISLGLSMKYALPALFLGHAIISWVIVLQGMTGATLHVPFPIQSRSSFGHHLSKFAVVSRVILALFWFGVQTYTGGQCFQQIIVSWSPSYRDFPNTLPESAGITSSQMISFLIFWLVQFPFLLIHPSRIRWFFLAKSILVPIAFISLFIWALATGGKGEIFNRPTTLSGSALGWAFLSALNGVLGNYATLSVNISDLTRYSAAPRSSLHQAVAIPVIFTLVAFIGIVVSSAAAEIYGGELQWNPLLLIDNFGDDAKGRAARFFCAFSFAFATIGTNVSANSISAANDLAALFPRYFDIRRGSILVAFVGGWCMAPWKILSSSSSFVRFLSSYTVFLGPIAGIMVADYWLLRRGRIDVPSLYLGREGRYYYQKGVNWRALLTLVLTVTPTLPGLANAINPSVSISQGATNLYSVTWLFSFSSSCVVYWGLSRLCPDKESYVPAVIFAHHEGTVVHDVEGRAEASPDRAESEKEKEATTSIGVHQI